MTHLVERGKDDSLGSSKLRLEDLDHRDPIRAYLQHATPGSSRGIGHPLGELDQVEISDFMSYSHWPPC